MIYFDLSQSPYSRRPLHLMLGALSHMPPCVSRRAWSRISNRRRTRSINQEAPNPNEDLNKPVQSEELDVVLIGGACTAPRPLPPAVATTSAGVAQIAARQLAGWHLFSSRRESGSQGVPTCGYNAIDVA